MEDRRDRDLAEKPCENTDAIIRAVEDFLRNEGGREPGLRSGGNPY